MELLELAAKRHHVTIQADCGIVSEKGLRTHPRGLNFWSRNDRGA